MALGRGGQKSQKHPRGFAVRLQEANNPSRIPRPEDIASFVANLATDLDDSAIIGQLGMFDDQIRTRQGLSQAVGVWRRRSDEVSISVRPEGANMPPLVSAGSNQSVALTNTAWLYGSVSDDALPYGVPLVIAWTKVSGPGEVTFADSHAPVTRATFSESGEYVLQLSADDSQFLRSAEVTFTIYLENQPLQTQAP